MKPSLTKYAARSVAGAYRDSHFRTVYFHKSGHDVNAAFDRYLTAIANAVDAFRKKRRVFTVLAATEALDARACHLISQKLGGGVPVFTSDEHDMYQMVSILRAGHMMASSRFHGIVTSMPALVPSAGITMDERIRNLMRERGHEHLLMRVDESDLAEKVVAALRTLDAQADEIRDSMPRTVARNLQLMARMGVYFEEQVARRFPEFPVRQGVLSWEDYLPPLSPGLTRLVEERSGAVTA